MTLRWIDRLGALVRADAHGALDALEERGLLLRQHLREAELEVVQKRARLEALAEEGERLGDEARRADEELAALDADVDLALGRGEEALARFAAARLLARRRARAVLAARGEALAADRARLAERLRGQEERLEELRRRVRAHLAGAARAEAEGGAPEPAVADEEVELELLRRRSGEAAR